MRQGTIAILRLNATLYDVGGNGFRSTSERGPEERVIVWNPKVNPMPHTGILAIEVVTDLGYFDSLARGGYQPPPIAYIATTDIRAETPEERNVAVEAERAKERAGKEILAKRKAASERPFVTNFLCPTPHPSSPSSPTSTQGLFGDSLAPSILRDKTKVALGLTLGTTLLLALYNPKHLVEVLTAGAALSATALYFDSR